MWLYYLPILTTLFCIYFASSLFRHYSGKANSTHILWWGFGVTAFGLGTLIESLITIFGWSDPLFRSWYIAGALMGGAPLAQGTVYLMLKKRTAHILSVVLVAAILFGSTMVILTPLDYSLVKSHLPQGDVIIWSWIRVGEQNITAVNDIGLGKMNNCISISMRRADINNVNTIAI